MTGSIYLIGGGELRDGETQLIDENLKSIAPRGSTFVFIGFAAQDSIGYAHSIKSVFGDTYIVVVPTKEKGRNYAVNALKSASIIYLGGGSTDLLINLFSEWNLIKDLIAALKRGVHIAGMSAGAQALASWYLDEDSDSLEIKKGWGIVSACVQVHASEVSVNVGKSLWLNSHKNDSYSFFAIGEKAALLVTPEAKQKLGMGEVWQIGSSEATLSKVT